jgi:hypothetical protein
MTAEELEKELQSYQQYSGVKVEGMRPLAPQTIREFSTGATRDTDTGKYDYEAFFSPLVLERRAKFMHKNRVQKDGSLRDGDNWQKGIPFDTYAKSEFRHHMEFWKLHRGLPAIDNLGNAVDIEDAICAAMFNLEGYLHELLKKKNPAE